MKKELQMFVQSPPHGVSCWTNDEDNMTQLTARKDMQTYLNLIQGLRDCMHVTNLSSSFYDIYDIEHTL